MIRLSIGMNAHSLFFPLLAFCIFGCSTHQSQPVSIPDGRDPVLDPLVGQRVTLRGQLRSPGKFGPFLVVGKTAIYMKPVRTWKIYVYRKIYDELDEHEVEVTGVLHFEHYPHYDGPPLKGVAGAIDHYWFEDETAEIRAIPRDW
jgi:hypothetical protein